MKIRQRSQPSKVNLQIFIFCLIIWLANSFNLTFQQFLNSKPSTFGLLTVTHARDGKYQYFKNHLHLYAQMQCPPMTEISVTWNNDVTPQSVGFVQDPKWKRPVYFVKTPYNSMDFRYMLPQQSTAKVFFNIDDDITITCQQLIKSFKMWSEKAVGDIAPILSYGPRGYDFDSLTKQYSYNDPLKAKFHSMSLVGVGWLSRFFLQLYYAERSWEISQMRKIVKQKNNCDDIALNFLVNLYFPELIPIFLRGNIRYAVHPKSQALSSSHYKFRSECLKQFSQIIGYNSLRLINQYDTGNTNRFVSQIYKYVVYLRRKQIAEKFIQKESVPTSFSRDTIQSWMSELKLHERYQKSTGQLIKQKQIMEKKDNEEQMVKIQLEKVKIQYIQEVREIRKKSQEFRGALQEGKEFESNSQQKMSENSIKTQNIQQLRSTLSKIAILGGFISILILFMFICLVSDCRDICSQQQLQKDDQMQQVDSK